MTVGAGRVTTGFNPGELPCWRGVGPSPQRPPSIRLCNVAPILNLSVPQPKPLTTPSVGGLGFFGPFLNFAAKPLDKSLII